MCYYVINEKCIFWGIVLKTITAVLIGAGARGNAYATEMEK